jgi:hypothetical protein
LLTTRVVTGSSGLSRVSRPVAQIVASVARVARRAAACKQVYQSIAVRILGPMRRHAFCLVLIAGCAARNATPSSHTCSVLNNQSQVEACVGKTITIRGKVSGTPRPSIIGVDVDASPDLFEKWGHAMGTLEKNGATFVLKDAGALAKAHPTKSPGQ